MSKYISDCLLVQYADDTQVILSDSINNLNVLMQKAETILLNIRKYFLSNGLLLNASKTQCIFMGSSQYVSRIPMDTTIKCNNDNIKISQQVINLGLHMDSYMNFSPHIDALCRKVSGMLMYLNRLKRHFKEETRIMIVQSLVLSVINYCIKIWGSTSGMYIDKVQKLQNFAARVAVRGIKKYDHITPTLKRLKWLKIKDRFKYEICTFVFKTLKNENPDWLYNFPSVGNIRDTSTRHNDDLYVRPFRTDIGSRAMMVRGPLYWNDLPQNVKDCQNLNAFKRKLNDIYQVNDNN